MNIFNYFKDKIIKDLKTVSNKHNVLLDNQAKFAVIPQKNRFFGDITTNIAFIYCNLFNLPPKNLAQELIDNLSQDPEIDCLRIGGNGFINITLKEEFWCRLLLKILQQQESFSYNKPLSLSQVHLTGINYSYDFNKCDNLSSANPNFYLRYTFSRIGSFLDDYLEHFPNTCNNLLDINKLKFLNYEEDLLIIKYIASWPKIIEDAITHNKFTKIVPYLEKLAHYFHSSVKKNSKIYNNKYIIKNNLEYNYTKYLLAKAIEIVIKNAFLILNINIVKKIY